MRPVSVRNLIVPKFYLILRMLFESVLFKFCEGLQKLIWGDLINVR